jgi:hypothetical protein
MIAGANVNMNFAWRFVVLNKIIAVDAHVKT